MPITAGTNSPGNARRPKPRCKILVTLSPPFTEFRKWPIATHPCRYPSSVAATSVPSHCEIRPRFTRSARWDVVLRRFQAAEQPGAVVALRTEAAGQCDDRLNATAFLADMSVVGRSLGGRSPERHGMISRVRQHPALGDECVPCLLTLSRPRRRMPGSPGPEPPLTPALRLQALPVRKKPALSVAFRHRYISGLPAYPRCP